MELNVFYKFAFISLLSTTILPFIIGIAGLGSKKSYFGGTLFGCIAAFIVFLICGLIYECTSKVTLNDVTINAHYVDGYTQRMTKRMIRNYDLPFIKNTRGGYALYFGGDVYHGVVRYDYVSKKSYQLDYSDYIKN